MWPWSDSSKTIMEQYGKVNSKQFTRWINLQKNNNKASLLYNYAMDEGIIIMINNYVKLQPIDLDYEA